MGITLLRCLLKKIFFFALLFGVSRGVAAQSTGDIAFIGINSHANEFAITALAGLPSNTTIYFTDAEWDGSFFKPGGGDMRWETGSKNIPPGTTVTFQNINTEEASVSMGNLTSSNIDLSSPVTTLISYTGSEVRAPTVFLAAISNREDQNYSGTGLTIGKEVILLNNTVMQAAYHGILEGEDAAEIIQLIGDTKNNWRVEADQTENSSLDDILMTSVNPPGDDVSAGQYTFMTRITGEEGWHGLSSPTKRSAFGSLLNGLWIQGLTGTADPGAEATVISWQEQEGGSFTYPENVTEHFKPGIGYFVYIAEDNDPNTTGVQGGFPKTIATQDAPQDRIVNIPVSANDADDSGRIDGMEGFNLLGNPFDQEIAVKAVKEELSRLSSNINTHLYIWNPGLGNGNGGFEFLNDADVIAPTQPFWVRYLDKDLEGTVRFERSSLAADRGEDHYTMRNDPLGSFEVKLGTEAGWFDTYRIELREGGEVGEDNLDGFKIFSLNPRSINLFSAGGSGNRLAVNVLPDRLEQEVEVPLLFSAVGRTELTFSWEWPDDLPPNWHLVLKDLKKDQEINLRTANSYNFKLEESLDMLEQAELPKEQVLLNTHNESSGEGRFSLAIRPSDSMAENETDNLPESIRLKPNYPNPFTNTTTIPYELDEAAEVTLTVWNMIGQKVATLIDGDLKSAGPHDEDSDINWNAANMPSGMYIARLEAGGEVFTRKMTLIK